LFLLKTFKALNGLSYADVPLRNYSLTHQNFHLWNSHCQHAAGLFQTVLCNWFLSINSWFGCFLKFLLVHTYYIWTMQLFLQYVPCHC